MNSGQTYWFPAKKIGWGWGPPTALQGWATLAVYIAALAVGSIVVPPSTNSLGYFAVVTVATLCLVGICLLKGEPQR